MKQNSASVSYLNNESHQNIQGMMPVDQESASESRLMARGQLVTPTSFGVSTPMTLLSQNMHKTIWILLKVLLNKTQVINLIPYYITSLPSLHLSFSDISNLASPLHKACSISLL